MRYLALIVVVSICLLVTLTGCERVSAPYIMKMDRHDQNLAVGNRGYLRGTPPPQKERGDLKREFIAIDIDLVRVAQKDEAAGGRPAAIEKRETTSAASASPKEEVK